AAPFHPASCLRYPSLIYSALFELYCRCKQMFAMSRIEALTEMLAHDPANAFARYGLAIEYSNSGQLDLAIVEFQKLLAAHPDYTAGYFMAAQTLAKCDRQDDAVRM